MNNETENIIHESGNRERSHLPIDGQGKRVRHRGGNQWRVHLGKKRVLKGDKTMKLEKITKEEYEFIRFVNVWNSPVQVNGIRILRRWGLRDGKRILHSLMRKGVLNWEEWESEDGVFSPIRRGLNYQWAIKMYVNDECEQMKEGI